MSKTASPTIEPVRERGRLASLDALRGFAIFGIFMVNVQFMALPFDWAVDPHHSAGADVWAWALTRTFFESNFVAIFSMLFGAGLVLQMTRAKEKDASFRPVYLRRLGLLMFMGIAHGIFLFVGDILFLYSIVGFLLFLCRKMNPRSLLLVGSLPLWIALSGALIIHSFGPPGSSEEEVAKELLVTNQGPLLDLISTRAFGFAFWMFISMFWFNWRVLSMLFLGAALMKLGFFEERRRGWHVRFALLGLSIGGGLEAFTTWASWVGVSGVAAGFSASLHELSSLILSLGYMGAICLLVRSGALSWLVRGVSCVGRASLSNYILQSVVANVLFTFIGFAWFGERTRWELIGIVCVTYTIQIALSAIWLRYFRMGPLEWVWRSVTYLRRQPLLR